MVEHMAFSDGQTCWRLSMSNTGPALPAYTLSVYVAGHAIGATVQTQESV